MTQENLVRFEFRNIKKNETEQTAEIERICFPPNEACTPEMMHLRVEKVPEMFLVAVDKATGKIAGFINGLSTNETVLRDEFFQNNGMSVSSWGGEQWHEMTCKLGKGIPEAIAKTALELG